MLWAGFPGRWHSTCTELGKGKLGLPKAKLTSMWMINCSFFHSELNSYEMLHYPLFYSASAAVRFWLDINIPKKK